MCELVLDAPLAAFMATGRVRDFDLEQCRRALAEMPEITREHAESYFAVDRTLKDHSACWTKLFEDVVASHLKTCCVKGEDDRAAEWFARCVSRRGLVDSSRYVRLLISVIPLFSGSPRADLTKLAAQQVLAAWSSNTGPYMTRRKFEPSVRMDELQDVISKIVSSFRRNDNNEMPAALVEIFQAFGKSSKTAFERESWNLLLASLEISAPRVDINILSSGRPHRLKNEVKPYRLTERSDLAPIEALAIARLTA